MTFHLASPNGSHEVKSSNEPIFADCHERDPGKIGSGYRRQNGIPEPQKYKDLLTDNVGCQEAPVVVFLGSGSTIGKEIALGFRWEYHVQDDFASLKPNQNNQRVETKNTLNLQQFHFEQPETTCDQGCRNSRPKRCS